MKTFIDTFKITPPRVNKLLERPSLIKRIRQNEEKGLTLILAQAAQGKSTLAASYINTTDLPYAWINIGPEDSDPVNLFFALVSSLYQAIKDDCFSSLLSYPSVSIGMGPKDPGFVFRDWSVAILEQITVPMVMIFDGLDQLPVDSPSYQFLQVFVDHLHPPLRLLILSRERPALNLQKLRMRQKALILSNEDLAFSFEETKVFFQKLRGIELSAKALHKIYTATNGWIGGLVLISHALEAIKPEIRESFIVSEIPSVFKERVFEYFGEEVFSSQPTVIKDFLIRSSIFEVVDPDIINLSLEIKESNKILQRCAEKNLFVQPVFPSKGSRIYRYHPMFRDFLRLRLNTEFSEKAKKALFFKAGSICEKKGLLEEAVKYFLQAEAYSEVAHVIQQIGINMLNMGRSGVIRQWLSELPKHIIENNPWLLLYQSITRRFSHTENNIKVLEKALALFEKEENLSGQLLCLSSLIEATMMLARDMSLMDSLLEKSENFMDRLPNDFYLYEKALLLVQMPYAYIVRRGDQRRALWASEKALIISKQLDILPLQVTALLQIMICYIFLGEFSKAAESYRRLERTVARCPYPEFKALQYIHYTHFCLWTGDLEEAKLSIEQVTRLTEEHGLIYLYPIGLLYKLALGFCLEDHAMATQAASKLIEFTVSLGNIFLEKCGIFFLGVSHYRNGDDEKAKELIGKALKTFSSDPERSVEHYMEGLIALGFVGYHDDSFAGYENGVKQALEHYRNQGSHYFITQAHLALALLRTRKSDLSEAYRHISEGFSIARKRGYNFFLYCARQDLVELCLLAITSGIDDAIDYASYLLINHLASDAVGEVHKLLNHTSAKARKHAIQILRSIHRSRLPRLHIQTLGSFQVRRGNNILLEKDWKGTQPKNLLKAIIARGSIGVQNDLLCDDLWPKSGPDSVNKTFRVALHRLRIFFEPDAERKIGFSYVHLKENKISLDKELCHVDADRFVELFNKGQVAEKEGKLKKALTFYEEAIELYKGDFLPEDIYSPWAEVKREELRGMYIDLLVRVARIHEGRRALRKAISYYLRVIEKEPLFEEAYQRLMLLYSARGEKNQAIRIYEWCKNALGETLNTEPSQTTISVYKKIID